MKKRKHLFHTVIISFLFKFIAIEDSAEDPRNKIFHASPLRKRREEKAFDVGEVVNGNEFE